MDDEKLLLSQARHMFTWTPSVDTIRRWISKGIKSKSGRTVRLNAQREGMYVVIAKADIEKFKKELNE